MKVLTQADVAALAKEAFDTAREEYGPSVELCLDCRNMHFEYSTEEELAEFLWQNQNDIAEGEHDTWTVKARPKPSVQ